MKKKLNFLHLNSAISFSYIRFRFWRALKHKQIFHLNKKKLLRVFSILTIAILSQIVILKFIKPDLALAWWDTSWLYRKKLIIDHAKVDGTSDLTNYPVLVNIASTDLRHHAQSDGDDIVFVSSSCTGTNNKCSHEIDNYNSSDGELYAWVEIPTLDYDNYTTVYMYYGNSSATSQEDQAGTWDDSRFVGVYHMSENPTGGAGSILDSDTSGGTSNCTPTDDDASPGTWSSSDLVNGKVYKAIQFRNDADEDNYLNCGSNAEFDFGTGDFSFLTWIYRTENGETNNESLIARNNVNIGGAYEGFVYQISPDDPLFRIRDDDGSGEETSGAAGYDLVDDAWHSTGFSAYRSGGTDVVDIYADGVKQVNDVSIANSSSSISDAVDELLLGKHHGSVNSIFEGILDEVWIIKSEAISDGFVSTYHNNLSDPKSFFYTVGVEENQDEPVVYWKFDEAVDNTCIGGSNDVCDSRPGLNDGTNTAAWQSTDFCISGNCLYFDGTNDVVTITNSQNIDFDNDLNDGISVSFWIRPMTDGENSTGEIFDKGSHFYCRTDSESGGFADLECSIDLVTTDATVNITDGLTLGQWHHIEATYGDNSNDYLSIYINGQLAGYADGSGAPIGTDSSNLLIGGDSSNNYHGFIDEFKIYAYERTAENVKTDYIVGATQSGSGISLNDQSYKYLSDGLIGYWKTDETTWTGNCSTESVLDSSGYNDNATACPNASAPTVTGGKFGKSGLFDGTNDYVDIGDMGTVDSANAITISTWVRTNTLTGGDQSFRDIISKEGDTAGTSSFVLRLDSANDDIEFYMTDGSSWYGQASTGTILADTWYHIVAVYNRSKPTSEELAIYLNGTLIDYADGPDSAINSNSTSVRISDGVQAGSRPWSGNVDDVRMYNRGLNEKEIIDLYNWTPTPLVYYNLDENSGAPNTIYDRSGNGNNGITAGTMTSADWVKGKFGTALDFDGSDDTIAIATASDSFVDFNGSEAFSGSAWVYIKTMPGTSNQDAIIAKYDQTSTLRGYRLVVENDDADTTGNFQIEIYDESTNQTLIATGSNDTVNVNTWYHIGFTFNGGVAGAAGDLNLYTNGILTGTNSANASFLGLEDVAVDFTIGNYDTTDVVANNTAFTGVIDDVKIYNYVINTGLLIEDMNASNPISGSPISSKYLHYKFDEGTGSTANNSGFGTSIDGSITSGTWSSSGKYDKALTFTASTSVTTTITDPAYTNSVSLWVYPTTSAASKTLVTSGKLTTDSSSRPVYGGCTGTAISTNTWTHIIAVSSSSTSCAVYQNGVLTSSGNTGVTFGTSVNIGSSSFTGTIDDVKLYNIALTKDQVKVDFNAGSAINFGKGINERLVIDPSPTPIDYATSLVGSWPLDENTGILTSYDKSGNSYDLTLTSISEPDWVLGKEGSAIQFDGSLDYATSGSENGNFSVNSYSVSAWIYRNTDSGGIEKIVSNEDADNDGWAMWINTSDLITCGYNSTDSTSTTTISTGIWYRATCTANGSTQRLYINGILEDSDSISGSISETTDLRIAAQSYGTSQKFTGVIDGIQVFNSALSLAQVAYEYNRGGPISWWRFDECTGTTANDAGSLGNDGTITIGASGNNDSAGNCSSGANDPSNEAWNAGTTGKFNASLDFDGTDDYITMTTENAEFSVSNYSASAWIYRQTDSGAEEIIIDNRDADNDGWLMSINSSDQVLCSYDSLDSATTATISTGSWYFVSCVADNDNIKTYINGIERASTSNTDDSISESTDVRIGARSYTSAANFFPGQIDDIRVYNYTLSVAQIKHIMNSGAIRFD